MQCPHHYHLLVGHLHFHLLLDLNNARAKRRYFLHPALFCSEYIYYKCNTYVIPTALYLETDSFKVTL